MQIAIRHKLSLALGQGIARSVQHVLLTPLTGPTQTVREWSIDMPGIGKAASFIDAFGNRAHLVSQTRPEGELTISVAGIVDTIDRNGVVGRVPGDIPPALYRRPTALTKAAGSITSKFRSTPKTGQDRIALLHGLMARVAEVVGGGEQSQSQDGQSQSQAQAAKPPAADYAHAFIGAARALDIPARYVTGYLYAEGDEPAALHAWAEAWDGGLGWIGFDPLLLLCPTDRHVRVAVGLDAVTTMPVRSIPVVGEPQVLSMSVEAAQ
ncbi:transglutaminase family protein [Devosia sp. ZB163]|uniref:transglutaminase family protein n=1 Tax=Devosia sp. ZB163 TaxID=3025938 RepID=UPI00235F54B7|nr:transglutaminase family protein [Devosia sp. ZB163]MDC9823535.1 transglutaminase family protein [Devosia sp. ZB163]